MNTTAVPASSPHRATEQELRRAFDACSQRARLRGLAPWPATFEEAMQDPICSRLMRVHAEHVAYPLQRRASKRRRAWAGAPAATPSPRLTAAAHRPDFIDIKRAASGDRDD